MWRGTYTRSPQYGKVSRRDGRCSPRTRDSTPRGRPPELPLPDWSSREGLRRYGRADRVLRPRRDRRPGSRRTRGERERAHRGRRSASRSEPRGRRCETPAPRVSGALPHDVAPCDAPSPPRRVSCASGVGRLLAFRTVRTTFPPLVLFQIVAHTPHLNTYSFFNVLRISRSVSRFFKTARLSNAFRPRAAATRSFNTSPLLYTESGTTVKPF